MQANGFWRISELQISWSSLLRSLNDAVSSEAPDKNVSAVDVLVIGLKLAEVLLKMLTPYPVSTPSPLFHFHGWFFPSQFTTSITGKTLHPYSSQGEDEDESVGRLALMDKCT